MGSILALACTVVFGALSSMSSSYLVLCIMRFGVGFGIGCETAAVLRAGTHRLKVASIYCLSFIISSFKGELHGAAVGILYGGLCFHGDYDMAVLELECAAAACCLTLCCRAVLELLPPSRIAAVPHRRRPFRPSKGQWFIV